MGYKELLIHDVKRLQKTIAPELGETVDETALIVLVGLPGSGKSYFAARLKEKMSAVVLESDFLRKNLMRKPVYSQFESFRLFRAIHELIKNLLNAKYSVVLDATNLSNDSRRPLYAIAREACAKIIVVHLNTPREIAEERLAERPVRRDGFSDADRAVYQKLEPGFEQISEPHYEITSPMDISPVIDKIVASITRRE